MKDLLKNNRGFLLFLICFGVFRSAIADWNPIPSGSMHPTLLEGDVVLVNRLAYDAKLPLTDITVAHLGDPARGDVVTFKSPRDGTLLIKRIVGLPGDTVAMRDGALTINGEAARYDVVGVAAEPIGQGNEIDAIRATETVASARRTVQYLPNAQMLRNFNPVTIPPGQYLMLGDNRDNSADSRVIGLVPRQLLVGKAHHILVSADILGNWLPRLERIAQAL
ncbi:MAG: signal peptidase I [Proteobacteria bacterium]|nr:signal peptidase I [Pseudomonadota bacterium]